MALLRRLAIRMLNQETSKKRSLKQKAKRDSMSPDYRLTAPAASSCPQPSFGLQALSFRYRLTYPMTETMIEAY